MSKKLKISLNSSLRPDLSSLFRSYLHRKTLEEDDLNSYYDEDIYNIYDDWYDDDCDSMLLYPLARYGHSVRNYSNVMNNKKFTRDDIYDEEDDLSYNDCEKEIWFYPDYHDKEDRLEFNSIKEFSDYCVSEGYFISDAYISDLRWRYESHCCLKSCGVDGYEVICEHSYGEMFYEACDVDELSEVDEYS